MKTGRSSHVLFFQNVAAGMDNTTLYKMVAVPEMHMGTQSVYQREISVVVTLHYINNSMGRARLILVAALIIRGFP
jgi:hypothetical protein